MTTRRQTDGTTKVGIWGSLIFAVVLSSLFTACAFDMAADSAFGPSLAQEPKGCRDDGDCMEGLVCDPAVKICVAPGDVELDISIRLVPPSKGSDMVEEQYVGLELGETNTFHLVIPRPIRVLGTVTDASGVTMNAYTIVAVSDGEIPGLDYYEISEPARVNEFTQDYLGGDGFEFYLKPDKVYDVYVHPTSEDGQVFPPFHAKRSFTVGEDPDHPYTAKWEFRLPDPSEYLRISGQVVLSSSDPQPVAGARVFARAPETGETSTTAVTDTDGGFEVLVQPPDADDEGLLKAPAYEMNIRPSDDNPVVPQVVAVEGLVFADDTDLGLLEVGHMGPPVAVSFAVQDPSGLFLSDRLGATVVRVSGEIGKGTILVEDVVDAAGTVCFDLPPGDYIVSAMPPAAGDLALLQEPLTVDPDRSELARALRLAPRPVLSGWVLSPDESPLEDVEVTAIFTGKGAYPTTSPLPERHFLTTTDADGAYSLRLDPGQYRILADPPVVSGLPRRIEHYVFVTSSEQRTIWLDKPVVVTGTVEAYPPIDELGQVESGIELDGKGKVELPATITSTTPLPAPNVKVEVFFHDPDADPEMDPEANLIPVAEGWTDETGGYLMVLPLTD